MSQRTADLTGANQSNLVARHGESVLLNVRRRVKGCLKSWLSLSTDTFKSRHAQLSVLP
jgi:hypothetical protein